MSQDNDVRTAGADPLPGSGGTDPPPRLLRRPVPALFVATHLGRLPCGMAPLALLLAATADGGDLARGGQLATAYGLAAAVGQPLLGRLADRRGQYGPLVGGSVAAACVLTALALVGTGSWPGLLLAAAAGAASPPLEACLRVLLRATVPPSRLEAAYALDASLQELVYALGPGLVQLTAALLFPQAALLSTALFGLVGAVWLASSWPSRRWRPVPRSAQARGWRYGPLGSPGIRRLLLALLCIGGALGALNVAALAAAVRHDADWLAAALPMTLSGAGIVGGAVYHRRSRPGGKHRRCLPGGENHRRMLWLTGAFAVAWVPLPVLDPAPVAAVALVALPGVCFIPLLTVAYRLVDELAPPGRRTEANTWLVAAFGASVALGHLAGEAGGSYAVPACASAAAVAALGLLPGGGPAAPEASGAPRRRTGGAPRISP
ncbi:hypothetical protein SRB5_39840 [Streptomyces sp. RB5]|uniref:MFS transporter n=1 Tax=Streptomyces smaragdinus TaxID=2585196 RepID=A0A7K0CK21_9ACTN|nr:MFS transporter [Streptomyces smaragdinus]MQY13828.1 hypothetical protein [Streptomyces smaragdinus]